MLTSLQIFFFIVLLLLETDGIGSSVLTDPYISKTSLRFQLVGFLMASQYLRGKTLAAYGISNSWMTQLVWFYWYLQLCLCLLFVTVPLILLNAIVIFVKIIFGWWSIVWRNLLLHEPNKCRISRIQYMLGSRSWSRHCDWSSCLIVCYVRKRNILNMYHLI